MTRPSIAVLLGALCVAGCGGELPRVDPASRLFGVNYPAWWRGVLASDESRSQLARARDARIQDVAIVWTGYQSTIRSFDLADDPDRTPTVDDVVAAAKAASELGLRVHVKPHVDLSADPDHWRGQIGAGFSDAEWDAWFARYRDWLVAKAAVARAIRADLFFVGTELSEASRRPRAWLDVVAAVRAEFPGRIAYDANWGDEAGRLDFAAFDVPAVSSYWPLADRCDAPQADLDRGWARALDALANVARASEKPVLIGEIGWPSADCGTVRPWDYKDLDQRPVDAEEQAMGYRAVLSRLGETWLLGVLFWDWYPAPSTLGDALARDYSPQGKPAEELLRTR